LVERSFRQSHLHAREHRRIRLKQTNSFLNWHVKYSLQIRETCHKEPNLTLIARSSKIRVSHSCNIKCSCRLSQVTWLIHCRWVLISTSTICPVTHQKSRITYLFLFFWSFVFLFLNSLLIFLNSGKSIPGKALCSLVMNCETFHKFFDKNDFQNIYLVPVFKCFDIP